MTPRGIQMRKAALVWILLVAIAQAGAAQEALIQARFFRASPSAEKSSLVGPEILSASSDPRLSPLLEKVDAPESELRAAALESLTKIYALDTTQFLFSQVLSWDGRAEIRGEPVFQPPAVFRLDAFPSWHFVAEINLRLDLYLKELPTWPSSGSPAEKAALRELRGAAAPDSYRKKMDKIFGADRRGRSRPRQDHFPAADGNGEAPTQQNHPAHLPG
jgi:hypothetical protein